MQLRHFLFPFFLLSLLALVGCQKESTTIKSPPWTGPLITPAKGLPGVRIGDAVQKAIDSYGNPSVGFGSANGNYTYYINFFNKGLEVHSENTTQASFHEQLKIKVIMLSSPFKGQTDKVIGIGSKKSEVIDAYGQPDSWSALLGDEYNIGIAFRYDDSGEVVKEIGIR